MERSVGGGGRACLPVAVIAPWPLNDTSPQTPDTAEHKYSLKHLQNEPVTHTKSCCVGLCECVHSELTRQQISGLHKVVLEVLHLKVGRSFAVKCSFAE